MGKTLKSAIAEVEKCAAGFRYYAEHGERLLAPTEVDTPAGHVTARWLPMGPVLAVMPWNFPYWQVIRFAAPTIMAGNVGLLKHASSVQGCAAAIEATILKAGAPEGLFQNPRDQIIEGRRPDRRRPHRRGDLDRQRGRGRQGRRSRGPRAQEGRARTRRVGPVRRHALRRHRSRRHDRGDRTRPEYRPVVHLREADDRPRRRL